MALGGTYVAAGSQVHELAGWWPVRLVNVFRYNVDQNKTYEIQYYHHLNIMSFQLCMRESRYVVPCIQLFPRPDMTLFWPVISVVSYHKVLMRNSCVVVWGRSQPEVKVVKWCRGVYLVDYTLNGLMITWGVVCPWYYPKGSEIGNNASNNSSTKFNMINKILTRPGCRRQASCPGNQPGTTQISPHRPSLGDPRQCSHCRQRSIPSLSSSDLVPNFEQWTRDVGRRLKVKGIRYIYCVQKSFHFSHSNANLSSLPTQPYTQWSSLVPGLLTLQDHGRRRSSPDGEC